MEHICVECEQKFDGTLGRNCDDCAAPLCCDCYDDSCLCTECEDLSEDEEDVDTEVDTEDEEDEDEDEDDDAAIENEYDEEDGY